MYQSPRAAKVRRLLPLPPLLHPQRLLHGRLHQSGLQITHFHRYPTPAASFRADQGSFHVSIGAVHLKQPALTRVLLTLIPSPLLSTQLSRKSYRHTC